MPKGQEWKGLRDGPGLTLHSPQEILDQAKFIVSTVVIPGLRPELLAAMAEGKKAVVLITNALGSVATDLHSEIRRLTDAGVAVFILPDNVDDGIHYAVESRGMIRFADNQQRFTLASGAIPFDKANINTEPLVIEAIAMALAEGKTGADLARAVQEKFAFRPGEERPVSPLGTIEGLREHKKKLAELEKQGWPE